MSPHSEVGKPARTIRKRIATILGAGVLAIGLTVGAGAVPAQAYALTVMVQGPTKTHCHGKITTAAMNPPSGYVFAKHGGCTYNKSLGYWIAPVSYNRR